MTPRRTILTPRSKPAKKEVVDALGGERETAALRREDLCTMTRDPVPRRGSPRTALRTPVSDRLRTSRGRLAKRSFLRSVHLLHFPYVPCTPSDRLPLLGRSSHSGG
eukprot:scaffold109789_cov75-Phaeocystis_antarctica.AAC.1